MYEQNSNVNTNLPYIHAVQIIMILHLEFSKMMQKHACTKHMAFGCTVNWHPPINCGVALPVLHGMVQYPHYGEVCLTYIFMACCLVMLGDRSISNMLTFLNVIVLAR
jgi:hypothetical protein